MVAENELSTQLRWPPQGGPFYPLWARFLSQDRSKSVSWFTQGATELHHVTEAPYTLHPSVHYYCPMQDFVKCFLEIQLCSDYGIAFTQQLPKMNSAFYEGGDFSFFHSKDIYSLMGLGAIETLHPDFAFKLIFWYTHELPSLLISYR